ncbi:MAG: metallophosphoesterase family protein [Trueperaceae bacterium]
MRLLVISDVHADARSLDTVLADAAERGWDQVVFLGDAIGYGSEPAAAVARLRTLDFRAALSGNHEAMLDILRQGRAPNAADRINDILASHLRELGPDDLEFLDRLQPEYLDDDWAAVHGALRTRFEYLISVPVARSNASHMKRDVYFVGHTHVPGAFLREPDGAWGVRPFREGQGTLRLEPGVQAFLNPGSVSLPRDRTPGSSYGIFDEVSRTFSVFRVN